MKSDLNPPTEEEVYRSDHLTGGSLAFVAVRCTLQYVVLPFFLPIFGLSGVFSAVISLIIDALALGMIAFNLKQLWPTSWRWRYLSLSALMISIIGLFVYQDVRFLLGI